MHLVRSACSRGSRGELVAYDGVNNRLEPSALCWIREDALAHALAIELPGSVQDLRSEGIYERGKRRLARRYDIAGNLVRVEHRNAERREDLGHRTLSARDAASERD